MGLKPEDAVRDRAFLMKCLALLGLTTLGFCFHGWLHLEPATVALLGASMFMLVGRDGARLPEARKWII
jgi:Na+/H+ antiporter NhaD/arsenite permease-like protein